jgi:hypothetical protein
LIVVDVGGVEPTVECVVSVDSGMSASVCGDDDIPNVVIGIISGGGIEGTEGLGDGCLPI